MGHRKTRVFIFFLPCLGALICALSYSLNVHLDLSGLSLRPIHGVILIAWLFMLESMLDARHIKWFPLVIGVNTGIAVGNIVNKGLFYGSIEKTAPIIAAGFVMSILTIPGIKRDHAGAVIVPKRLLSNSIVWPVLAGLLIVIIRLANIVTRHSIPNENRSILIAGAEIHHAITGFFIAAFVLLVLFNRSRSGKIGSFFSGLLLLCLALIADQLSYILMFPLTDEAFFSIFSMAGASIAGGYLVSRVLFTRSVGPEKNAK